MAKLSLVTAKCGSGKRPLKHDVQTFMAQAVRQESDLVQRMDQTIQENKRLQYCKLCARYIPKMMSDHHNNKKTQMGTALMFLKGLL